MTKAQKLAIELSELRQKINELTAKEALDDAERSALATATARWREAETEYRAALIAEGGDGEQENGDEQPAGDAQLAALEARAAIADVFAAALTGRQTDGATAELQGELGLNANQVPLALLETRAATPAPATVGTTQQPIVPGVFPAPVAGFLGVDMPRVNAGDQIFPVLATNATVHAPAEGAAAAETDGSFTAAVLNPGRLQAAFSYSREDRARFPAMESALRENLGMALGDKLDAQIVAGANGLLTGTNLPNNNAAAAFDYGKYRDELLYGRVDGKWAGTTAALRFVFGAAVYAAAAKEYRDNTADNQTALDLIQSRGGGLRVSAHVPAAAANKQNCIIRLGDRRDMVAPVWEGVSLVPDEITGVGTGTVKVTAIMLYAVKILRTDGFSKRQVQTQ